MTATLAFLLGLAIAIPLAFVINCAERWWKWRKFIHAVEFSAKREAFLLRSQRHALSNCDILPPHKSAARPSNVRAIQPQHK